MGNTIKKILAPVAEIATAIFLPELAPILLPLEGAAGGLISGGGLKGALTGGLEGLVGGQLAGIGSLAPLSSGTTSALGEAGNFLSSSLGIGADAASGLLGAAGGAVNSLINKTNPLTGALEGGALGYGSSALSGGGGLAKTAGTSGTATSAAAPADIPLGAGSGDVTAAFSGAGGGSPLDASFNNVIGSAISGAGAGAGAGSGAGAAGAFGGAGASLDSILAGPAGAAITGGAGGSGGTTGATTSNSLSNLLAHPSLSTLGSAISANSNLLIPAAGLAYSAIQGNKMPPGYDQIASQAAALGQQGTQLSQYLTSGTLPPGIQSGVNQASEAAKATIRSRYAAMGMSGSSSEAQDLAAVDERMASEGANIGMQLLQQGVSETGLSSQLYQALMGTAISQDQQLADAIGAFSKAAA